MPIERQLRANTRSIRARAARPAVERPSEITATIGSARTATSTASGTSRVTVQVSSAPVVAATARRSPAATGPASSGTTRLASAPPATISKMMLGTVLAMTYMPPRSLPSTTQVNTAVRPNPASRARTVSTAMRAAAPATRPAAARGAGLVTSVGSPAQRVEVPQHRGALDDRREADLLAGRGEAGEDARADRPGRAARYGRRGHPEQRAERVGPPVADHHPLAEILVEQPGRRHRPPRRRHAGVRAAGQRHAEQHRRLQRPAGAQVEPKWRRRRPGQQLSLTVYNKDLALIEHVRGLNLPAGRHRIEFKGVSARIVPQTVSVWRGRPGPGRAELRLRPADPFQTDGEGGGPDACASCVPIRAPGAETIETAEVLSTVGGVVLRIGNRIEVLRDDGIPARVIFDKVPENLRASPTLSVLAEAPPGRELRPAPLIPVARAVLGRRLRGRVRRGRRGDLAAGLDHPRQRAPGTSFDECAIQLVAGDLNIVGNEEQWWQRFNNSRRSAPAPARRRHARAPPGRSWPTTMSIRSRIPPRWRNNQTKQVSFLAAEHVKAGKGYERRSMVSTRARIRSRRRYASVSPIRRAAGLGEQLPSGVVRVYARDAQGQPQFVGEDRIGHTERGLGAGAEDRRRVRRHRAADAGGPPGRPVRAAPNTP